MTGPREARLQRREDGRVRCLVCERACLLGDGMTGSCGNYANFGGTLYHSGYGKLSHLESRPIEIKPLFHYWPGSTALTYSNYGCNFYCPWCQNHEISFSWPPKDAPRFEPSDLVNLARIRGDEGISASLNEPATNFDFVMDASELASKWGLYSMVVTNGYFTLEALRELIRAGVDGWSIDIKGCPEMASIRVLPHVNHELVFRNAREVLRAGGHVEIVYLLVTGANDTEACFEWIIDKFLEYLSPEVPLHLNRYFPANRWREPPTELGLLLRLRERAIREGLSYVYVGNVWSPELESTYCPRCGRLLIYRPGRAVRFDLIREGNSWRCPRCGRVIPIRGRIGKSAR
ncbi:MAG: radical SAM protein [Candidatus Korarchaeota archaeon NZ13-K]|nr:MAG: radical SAM protein [Candidatus Korarchaeota archaeon NZ13-K]